MTSAVAHKPYRPLFTTQAMEAFVRLRERKVAADVHDLQVEMGLSRENLVQRLARDLMVGLDSLAGNLEGEKISLRSGHPAITARVQVTADFLNFADQCNSYGLEREVLREALHDYHLGSFFHSDRVREAVVKIADYRSTRANQNLFLAAQFHDIGKLAVPKCLLNTDSELLPGERSILEQHQVIGYLFLRSLKSLERVAAIMQFTHIEKGYPEGIAKEKIPFDAHFLIIADAMDACLLDREYRRGPCMTKEQVLEELVDHKNPRHPLSTLTATTRVLEINYFDAVRILGKGFRQAKEMRFIEKTLG